MENTLPVPLPSKSLFILKRNLRSGVPFVFVGAGKGQKQKGRLIAGYLKSHLFTEILFGPYFLSQCSAIGALKILQI